MLTVGKKHKDSLSIGVGYNKGRTNVCGYQSISLSVWPLLFLLQVSWMYCQNHVFFLTAGKTSCGKCGVTQAVIGNDWDCPSKPRWGLFRTWKNNREGLGQERISSQRCCHRLRSSQTPGTQLGGGCWGVHFDSWSHEGCLLLLVGFPVIPQSLQTLEFVCISACMVGGVGRLLVSEALVVFECNFLP